MRKHAGHRACVQSKPDMAGERGQSGCCRGCPGSPRHDPPLKEASFWPKARATFCRPARPSEPTHRLSSRRVTLKSEVVTMSPPGARSGAVPSEAAIV